MYYLMAIHPFKIDLWKPLTAGSISMLIIFSLYTIFGIKANTSMIILLSAFFLMYYSLLYVFKLSEEDMYMKAIIEKKIGSLLR